jgi:N utilization substance protein B
MSKKRRLVREKVLQALYAYEFSKNDPEVVAEDVLSELKGDKEQHAFAKTLFLKAISSGKELDALIKLKVEHWEFSRLAVIDKLILRMAIAEILFFDDIPPKVSINEAIEIARDFSTVKSDKFVNGVLDSVLDSLKKSGKLSKTGRGLLDHSLNEKQAP